jgi:hypothetical protein
VTFGKRHSRNSPKGLPSAHESGRPAQETVAGRSGDWQRVSIRHHWGLCGSGAWSRGSAEPRYRRSHCEVDILKEGFNRPPETTPYGPVLALDDVIGTKVRALADRGYPRDLVDIHAASRIRSQGELESLGRRCAWDVFSLEELATRLSSVQWRADEEFSAYGLSGDEIANLRSWAQAWSDDINRRLYAETYVDDEDEET